MGNLFDSANYAITEPTEIIAGDYLAWKRTDLHSTYSNSLYVLKYSLRLNGTGAEIEITASASGDDYVVEVASATTASYTPGRYGWQGYITRSSDSARLTLNTGEINIVADRDESSANPITHLRQRLDNLNTAIETLSSKTSTSYSIAGRSMSYADLPSLIEQRNMVYAELNTKTVGRFGVRL